MATALEVDFKGIVLSNSSFGPNEIDQLSGAICEDFSHFGVLRDLVGELELHEDRSPAMSVRLGVCYYLLGKFRLAEDTLSNADGGAIAQFYLGRSRFALQRFAQAIECYHAAKSAGYDPDLCVLAVAEAQRNTRDYTAAFNTLNELFGPVEQTAEYLYQRGATIAAMGENPMEVCALYERAVEANSNHAGALFGLGLENDRRGNDVIALELYQKSADVFPSHVGALLNLGVLYEDREQYERSRQCYQRILDIFPTNQRARLYLRDASASGDMFYDEEAQKRRDRLAQVLSIPVTDFELSVRSRNCLQKIGVNTLGDLTRTSEQSLLTSKNFGETSLVEIREMLTSKGLELGQFADQQEEIEIPVDTTNMSEDEQAMMDRPISDLNLSVRARKCMVRLGMNTIGELLRKTGDDLLECKNFGVTSLNEVREKLTQASLKLRGD